MINKANSLKFLSYLINTFIYTLLLYSFTFSNFLAYKGSLNSSLILAIKNHELNEVKGLLESGADINYIDPVSNKNSLQISLSIISKYLNFRLTPKEKKISSLLVNCSSGILFGEAFLASLFNMCPLYIENNSIKLVKTFNKNERIFFVKSRLLFGVGLLIAPYVWGYGARRIDKIINDYKEIIKLLISHPDIKASLCDIKEANYLISI